MIRLIRSRAASAIPPSLCGQDLIDKEQELLAAIRQLRRGQIEKLEFKSGYWGKAKKQLKKESFGKCAYCESPTDTVAHGDVEHFRPKSKYWWLAYCYDNYLYSCQICNQTHKSDHFPPTPNVRALPEPDPEVVPAGSLAIDPTAPADQITAFLDLLTGEEAALINPYYEDPEPYFIWQADDTLGEVTILPNPDGPPKSDQVYEAAKEFYGLARKELRVMRYQMYRLFWVLKQADKQRASLTPELADQIREQIGQMKAAKAPYAAMIRYFDKVL
jgi:hypothetical protein